MFFPCHFECKMFLPTEVMRYSHSWLLRRRISTNVGSSRFTARSSEADMARIHPSPSASLASLIKARCGFDSRAAIGNARALTRTPARDSWSSDSRHARPVSDCGSGLRQTCLSFRTKRSPVRDIQTRLNTMRRSLALPLAPVGALAGLEVIRTVTSERPTALRARPERRLRAAHFFLSLLFPPGTLPSFLRAALIRFLRSSFEISLSAAMSPLMTRPPRSKKWAATTS